MLDTLLVPTDGTEKGEIAVDWALELAAERGASVRGLYVNSVSDVVPAATSPAPPEEISNAARREGENALRTLTQRAPESVEVTTEIREGNPAEVIVDYASDHDVDAVVMARKGTSLLSRLGSNTGDVVRFSDIPVVVVPVDE